MQRNKLVTISFSMLAVAMSLVVIHSSPAEPIGFYAVTNLIGSRARRSKTRIWSMRGATLSFPTIRRWINDEGTGVFPN